MIVELNDRFGFPIVVFWLICCILFSMFFSIFMGLILIQIPVMVSAILNIVILTPIIFSFFGGIFLLCDYISIFFRFVFFKKPIQRSEYLREYLEKITGERNAK